MSVLIWVGIINTILNLTEGKKYLVICLFFTNLLQVLHDKEWQFEHPSLPPHSNWTAEMLLLYYIFLKVGTPSGVHIFDHLLWSIFQSSIFTHYIIQFFKPRFYSAPFKFEFNQLLIFIERLSSLSGFEPGTSPVPSQYATDWAILAWKM